MPDNSDVELFILTNASGAQASVTTYGATLVSLLVPGNRGKLDDVILGYDGLAAYRAGSDYLGATIGRYANRIANGRFTLGGRVHTLSRNEGHNTLHGGLCGFDKKLWQCRPVESNVDTNAIEMMLKSSDGEEGFPGNLTVRITFILNRENELRVNYHAVSDRDTPVNFTNHAYFNLLGSGDTEVLGHELEINADRFLPVDAALIPTGELIPVEGTPFDFRTPTTIGSRINTNDEQMLFGKGYDHTWVLNRRSDYDEHEMSFAARALEPATGRAMEIWTTEPGLQFYSGNVLKPALGRGGSRYRKHSGFCLETQHFPDSPNKPQFPSTILRRGCEYSSATVIRFC
jgi:aldose 1-epimerase